MEPGDIAFKSNFATLNPETGIIEKRRADRHFEDLGPVLCQALDGAPLCCAGCVGLCWLAVLAGAGWGRLRELQPRSWPPG